MSMKKAYDIAAILEEMRQEYWRGIEEGTERAVEQLDFLIFRLAGERFGIPTGAAREVLRMPKLVRVPRLPEMIQGVVNLRGQIVAVTDLRPLLGLAGREVSDGARLVVIEAPGFTTALLVEAVEGIRSLPVNQIEPLTPGLTGFPREAALGQVAEGDGFLILLDIKNLLARPELIIQLGTE